MQKFFRCKNVQKPFKMLWLVLVRKCPSLRTFSSCRFSHQKQCIECTHVHKQPNTHTHTHTHTWKFSIKHTTHVHLHKYKQTNWKVGKTIGNCSYRGMCSNRGMEVYLPAILGILMIDRPTNRPTNQQTNRRTWGAIGKLNLQYTLINAFSYSF